MDDNKENVYTFENCYFTPIKVSNPAPSGRRSSSRLSLLKNKLPIKRNVDDMANNVNKSQTIVTLIRTPRKKQLFHKTQINQQ